MVFYKLSTLFKINQTVLGYRMSQLDISTKMLPPCQLNIIIIHYIFYFTTKQTQRFFSIDIFFMVNNLIKSQNLLHPLLLHSQK